MKKKILMLVWGLLSFVLGVLSDLAADTSWLTERPPPSKEAQQLIDSLVAVDGWETTSTGVHNKKCALSVRPSYPTVEVHYSDSKLKLSRSDGRRVREAYWSCQESLAAADAAKEKAAWDERLKVLSVPKTTATETNADKKEPVVQATKP